MGGRRWEKEQRGTHSPQNPLGMGDVERRCQIRVSTDQLQTAEANLAPKQGQLVAEDLPHVPREVVGFVPAVDQLGPIQGLC